MSQANNDVWYRKVTKPFISKREKFNPCPIEFDTAGQTKVLHLFQVIEFLSLGWFDKTT